ncbi:hypothetical protein F4818DRAFT_423912 [Hypoxylon cercidicola]|nr:hypothetical protein F4818DRAFT_423912 [Hypoxylon cercidicola]
MISQGLFSGKLDPVLQLLSQVPLLHIYTSLNIAKPCPLTPSGFKLLGQAKTETNGPDCYESFNVSQDGLMGNKPLQELPPVVHPSLLIVTSYLKHCQDIVALINSTIATQLGLPADTFTSLQSPTQLSGTIIRFLKALASPRTEDLRTAFIHHADFGTITLLANVVGGLQILSPGKTPADESAWLWVKP